MDPLMLNGGRVCPLADGFALGVIMLQVWAGVRYVVAGGGIIHACHDTLCSHALPAKWVAPGLPDMPWPATASTKARP